MKEMSTLGWVAFALVMVGGLNWGLVAALNFDLVATLFGAMSTVSRVVYGLVGLSTLYMLVGAFKKM